MPNNAGKGQVYYLCINEARNGNGCGMYVQTYPGRFAKSPVQCDCGITMVKARRAWRPR